VPIENAAKNPLPALTRYTKAVVLTPTIGSLLLCLLALLPASILLLHHGRSADQLRTLATTRTPALQPAPSISANQPRKASTLKHAALYTVPATRPTPTRLKPAFFNENVSSDDLRFLNALAGTPTSTAVRSKDVRALINNVIPYVPFHFGIDYPLTLTLGSILAESSAPVTIRDGRYVVMATLTNHNNLIAQGRRRALLWVDLQTGMSIGAIFFYPSNGEPTPTLSLFSRQVEQSSLAMSQLPPAFLADYKSWLDNASMPILSTRYFINARGDKTVLTHDEDLCAVLPASETCAGRKRQAEDIDLQAANYLGQTHYASNATLRMVHQSE